MDIFLKDLRYGVRLLFKSPGVTLVAIFSLALGIGANTAIFSLVDKTLLRALPVEEPERLVTLARYFKQNDAFDSYFSYPAFAEYRERNRVFEELACYSHMPLSLSDGNESQRIEGMIVSGNYFKALRVSPAPGRGFLPEEDQTPGAHPVAVLSHGLWQRRFGADPKVVGRTINLNGHAFTVVGVAPPEFTGTRRGFEPDIYVPMMMLAEMIPSQGRGLADSDTKWLLVFGRLNHGVTGEQAETEIDMLGVNREKSENEALARAQNITPNTNSVWPRYVLEDGSQGHTSLVTDLRFPLKMLMAIVALVLLIACANVANLLLARAGARQKEIAIRLALGSGRGRLIRQLLTESALLSVCGGAVGLMLAEAINQMLVFFTPPNNNVSLSLDGNLDARVLAFTLILSVLTGLVSGLAPALGASRPNLITAMKDETLAVGNIRRLSLRNLLVVAQVALSFVVLVGAGLCIRSLQKQQAIDAGFESSRVLLMSLDVSLNGYDEARGQQFYRQLMERVKSLPGVESASLALVVMLSDNKFNWTARIDGYEPQPGENMTFRYNIIGPEYFQTMGIPLSRGRDFNDQDTAAGQGVVIINEALANRYWPDQDPIGKRLGLGGKGRVIVGVVKDSKYASLTEETKRSMYLPVAQNYRPGLTLHLRSDADPRSMIAAVRHETQAIDSALPVFNIKTLEEQKSRSLYTARMAVWLLSIFGLLALLLAGIGLYGVMAYAVNRRTREIGIRMALGASSRDVLRLVIGEGALLIVAGLVIGLGGAMAATRLVSSFLYGVSATDPVTFVVIAMLLMAVALAANYLPARRATRVDPMVALRYE